MEPLGDRPRSLPAYRQTVRRLFEPLLEHWSRDRARILPGPQRASFSAAAAGMEGFARPLWALAPLAAGGGTFDHWDAYRRGLVAGTDPDHPEYWGDMPDEYQLAVEAAPISVALSLVPEHIWDPLESGEQARIGAFLRQINDLDLFENNWRFFRVLTNHGLASVGESHDPDLVESDLELLHSLYVGDGWYDERDYYTAWEFHVDGLLYATLRDDDHAARFRERARAFAPSFARWFTSDGDALPFGRSLTYRFAQGSFWGALAVADEPALDWGVLRGLWERHFAYWARQPVAQAGVLSVGYEYPSLRVADAYNSPGSPYWGMKFFLPLLLDASHPFWQADPATLPDQPKVDPQPAARQLLCRDGDHVFSLSGSQQDGPKYAKLAYSTRSGFGIGTGPAGPEAVGPDSTLLLSADGTAYRGHEAATASEVTDEGVFLCREPFEDVVVQTWLVPDPPWHVRLHHLDLGRDVETVEGGFAIGRESEHGRDDEERETDAGKASARTAQGASVVRDPLANRQGEVLEPAPNANVRHPRTLVPALRADLSPGEHWLVSTVGLNPRGDPPSIERGHKWVVRDPSGNTLARIGP